MCPETGSFGAIPGLGSLWTVSWSGEPYSIYSTWGFHDELGDTVHLTEAIAHQALDRLERWQKDHGFRYDYFHLDAFWFDPARGYHHFHPDYWPNGFGPVLSRIRALGMSPGLWYSTCGSHLNPDAWAASRSANNWHFSLADGPYGEHFEEAVITAARDWGVRFFKFDFADFGQRVPGSARTWREEYEQSNSRFRAIIHRLNHEFPDAVTLIHCGFTRYPFSDHLGSQDRIGPDLSFLAGIDKVFSGDPHYASRPQTALIRGLDLYQDRNVWRMVQEGFPIHRIDDHGMLLAKTNTCHRRGAEGFARTYVGQLARGGRRDMFYGDPTLLGKEEVEFMVGARELFVGAFIAGLSTRPVGPGEPGITPWHGFLTGEGTLGLLLLTNSTLRTQLAELDLVNLNRARVLWHEGLTVPAMQVRPDHLAVELQPEQCVLIGLGEMGDCSLPLAQRLTPALPIGTRLVSVDWSADERRWSGQISGTLHPEEVLHVRVEVDETHWTSVSPAPPKLFAHQQSKSPHDVGSVAHDLLPIECRSGSAVFEPVRQIPDVPIWSGVAHITREFRPAGPCEITLRCNLEAPFRLRPEVWAIRYESRR